MDEVTTDALEASFEAVERAGLPPVRPMLDGGRPLGSAAFEGFLRSGSGGLEMKALSGVSDAAGGYAVPEEIDGKIDATLKAVSPIRSIANVVKVGSSGYRKLVTSGGIASGWAAETAARTETATPVFNEVAPPSGDLYANPAASQTRHRREQPVDRVRQLQGGYLIAERGETPVPCDSHSNKPFVHFWALARLDLAVQGAVVAAGADTPPASPEPGACWFVGAAPVGAWAGQAHALAGWTSAGWIFVAPREGMQLWLGATQGVARFSAGAWHLGALHGKVFVEGDQVVGPRVDAIAEPSGGAMVDAEARTAIVSVLEALRAHGLIEGG